MKHRQRKQKQSAATMIGEMMLAKTVLEEKNELIDDKDRIIRKLCGELLAAKGELQDCLLRLQPDPAEREGARRVVEEVVRIVADFDECGDPVAASCARRVITLFQRDYGLEVMSAAPARIDPEIHRVAQADDRETGGQSIQVLARGYRVEGRIIRPMMLRVVRDGVNGCAACGEPNLESAGSLSS